MSSSRTTTSTIPSTVGSSRSRPVPPPPPPPSSSAIHEEEDFKDKDEDDIIRKAQARVEKGGSREEEEGARGAEAGQMGLTTRGGGRGMETVVGHCSDRKKSAGYLPQRYVGFSVEARCRDSEDDEDTDLENPSAGALRMMQGKKDLLSDAGWPLTVKREGGSNPTGERLAVLESQVAQLLADNQQLRDGQVKANTYHRHFNRKLDWLITDAARRRKSPPEMPEAGPSGLLRKRRRVVNSDEEEAREIEERAEKEVEKDGKGEEEEVEEEETAPMEAHMEKGKERAE
ncbi:hypothetical protein GG344DRAFT_83941 [Lentinula edodes]|nr:hypothetical protein GG344DRAFT_83941 [Lentinula edodes]